MKNDHYIEHLFNKQEKEEFNAITGNKFPYYETRGTDDFFYYYAPHTKATVKKLIDYFDNKNIDLYAHAIDYFSKNKTPQQKPDLLDFFVMGIKDSRINVYDKPTYAFLESLFDINFTSKSKVYFESKLFILQKIIEQNYDHMDKLGSLLTQYNKQHGFDRAMNENLKEYITYGLPSNLIGKYPDLVEFYSKLQAAVPYKKNKSYLYTLEIDSNAIANTHNVTTKEVQNNLLDSLFTITELLKSNAIINNEKENFVLEKSSVSSQGNTDLLVQIYLKNEKSYSLVDKMLDDILPELIEAIANKNPYSKNDIPKLMGKILLQDKIQEIAVKENKKNKKKI